MTDKVPEFEEIPEGNAVVPPVSDDPASYGGAAPKSPNSVLIPFGKGFVSWQSDNPIAVLALMMLIVIVLTLIILGIISSFSSRAFWIGEVSKLLGQAALTIVGAIIGSAATNKSKRP